jgi:uncharacterized protein YejL (UPF0352 family)
MFIKNLHFGRYFQAELLEILEKEKGTFAPSLVIIYAYRHNISGKTIAQNLRQRLCKTNFIANCHIFR